MRTRFAAAALVLGIAILSACSGGGSNAPVQQGGAQTQTVALNATPGGLTGSVTYPSATSGSGAPTATLIDPATATGAAAAVVASTTVLGSSTLTVNAPETLSQSPSFTLTLQSAQVKGLYYFASFYNGSSWQTTFLTGKISGTTVTFASNPNPLTLEPGIVYVFEFYSTTSAAGASPSPVPIPSPSPSAHAASPVPSASPSHAASPVPSASPSHAASPVPSASPSHAASPVPSASPSPAPSAAPLTGPSKYESAWGPPAVASAFQFPVQSGYNGTGVTVGIIIDSDVTRSDISTYLSYFEIPTTSRTITTESVDSASGIVAGEEVEEATLDTETIAGLAPGANIIIYQIPEIENIYFNDAVNTAASSGIPKVVSMSFGGCESAYGSYALTEEMMFASAASSGITFVASSGDIGNQCTNSAPGTVGVNYPASDPNITAAGGNESSSTTSLTNTVAWNDSVGASGGGVSGEFTLPSYQSSGSSSTYRNVPDIAMPSVNDALYLTTGGYDWNLVANGTSWSAPEMAAMFAEIVQYCNNSSLGAANALLYQAHASAPSDFIDVTSGNNDWQSTSPYYSAGSGYDNTTGLGMPKGMSLAATICPGHVLSAAARRGSGTLALPTTTHDDAYAMDLRLPLAAHATDLGERDASAAMAIQIVLTPAAARMGQDGPVVTALKAAGLTITRTFSNHAIVDARGTTAQVEALFGTRIHRYAQPQHGERYAPASAATIPASLAPYLGGAILDNFVTMKVGRHH
jgi:hypothetical protein